MMRILQYNEANLLVRVQARRAVRAARASRWRNRRLLILCFHGVSQRDEHQWKPALYVTQEQLARRMEKLRADDYQVLGLADALQGLYLETLPERSVAVTFDDGAYDFYTHAFPVLWAYSVPATVYLTSYYCAKPLPVFGQNLFLHVMEKPRSECLLSRDPGHPGTATSGYGRTANRCLEGAEGSRRPGRNLLAISKTRSPRNWPGGCRSITRSSWPAGTFCS